MISLIIGIFVLMSFCYVLYECVKQERDEKIWVLNSLNLIMGILMISNYL